MIFHLTDIRVSPNPELGHITLCNAHVPWSDTFYVPPRGSSSRILLFVKVYKASYGLCPRCLAQVTQRLDPLDALSIVDL